MRTEPYKEDSRFMADMLGLRPEVDYESRGYVLSDKPGIVAAVAGRMRDPIAAARASQRIQMLIDALPRQVEPLSVLRPSHMGAFN